MAERIYSLRGKSLTAAQVADLDNPTDEEKKSFAKQAGMTDRDLMQIDAMASAVVPLFKDYVRDGINPLVDRLLRVEEKIIELEDRIAELEERPPADWEVYSADKNYKRGVFVTYAGSMFFARAESKGVKPGTGDACWKLCVKRGSA